MEFGGEGREIPHGLSCPKCPGKRRGRLWRHGQYERGFRSKSWELQKIQILRLRCSKCGKSQACLFDFLVPYRQYSAEALGELVWPYLVEEEMTYEEYEWGSEDGRGHRNLVFKVIERLCQMYVWLAGQVERDRLRPGESLWKRMAPESWKGCINARKAKTEGKEAELNHVSEALRKCKKQARTEEGGRTVGILQRLAMTLPAPFSLLTGARALELYAPQKAECRLF